MQLSLQKRRPVPPSLPEEPVATTLRERIDQHSGKLTLADHRLLDALFADPRRSAFLSTHGIAERAEVHPTTAVRLARKLGFDGYPALRASLQTDLFRESDAAERVRRRIERLGKGEVLKAFVQSEIRALSRLPEQVGDRQIAAAARAIVRAGTVFLFATGHSETLARLLQIRLTRGGYDAVMLAADAREAAAALRRARRGDAFVLFSFFSIHPRIPRILAHAREVRAATVLVTDVLNPAQWPPADIVLAASRGETGEARSLTVPMALCNTIVLQVSRLDGGRMIRNLERLEDTRAALEQSP
jgi:DNA-binding MurR/RpiR family transcriptional regulator